MRHDTSRRSRTCPQKRLQSQAPRRRQSGRRTGSASALAHAVYYSLVMRPRAALLFGAAVVLFGTDALRVPIIEHPSPNLTPIQTIEAQLSALSDCDDRRAFRFASPELKRRIGSPHRRTSGYIRQKFYLAPPKFDELPGFAPLYGCIEYSVLGALALDDHLFHATTRVYTSDGCSIDVAWKVEKQPERRPACYEDDPLQAGISAGPPGAGCWMIDSVRRGDGGRDGARGGDDGGGGDGVERPVPSWELEGVFR